MYKSLEQRRLDPKRLMQFVHTCRYLRFRQIYYRLYYSLYKTPLKILAPYAQEPRVWPNCWKAPLVLPSGFSSSGEMTYIGETGSINSQKDWNSKERSKLWLYNLHYFDELNTKQSDIHKEKLNDLIERWIIDNPPIHGTGWEPYPLSLRLVNLIKWYLRYPDIAIPERLCSLGQQAKALSHRIEYQILANHLFANAKALIFAGSYLSGPSADHYMNLGLDILDRELKEQFLPDGGHFELSPMYHATLLWDMCDLVHLAQCSGLAVLERRQAEWKEVIYRGLVWLQAMLHPDQKISFFNDSAFGVAPEYNDIRLYAAQLAISEPKTITQSFFINWLKDSGYCAVYLANNSKAIIDMAKIGPDYQPGHAHADTLSFELSLFGSRFLVNSGTSQYGTGEQRDYERSTEAHNTLCINGESSSEVWSGFRVARRAYPQGQQVDQKGNVICIKAAHNGYRRLAGRNLHHREWHFTQNRMIVRDKIDGIFYDAITRFYFHPDVRVKLIQGDLDHLFKYSELSDNYLSKSGFQFVECILVNQQKVYIKVSGSSQLKLENTFWFPEFGIKQNNKCLLIQANDAELLTEFVW